MVTGRIQQAGIKEIGFSLLKTGKNVSLRTETDRSPKYMRTKKILVTGAAGFIGSWLTMRLLKDHPEISVVGYDNLNPYYPVSLKEYRLDMIDALPESEGRWTFVSGELEDREKVRAVFDEHRPEMVVNLAAQAGVRRSLREPEVYLASNVIGFFNILESCREYHVGHLVFASSSSVYGDSRDVPFEPDQDTDHPVSFYAATKKTNEVMGYAYSKCFGIPMTALRFFSVYGPAGRPDMAYYHFSETWMSGKNISLFDEGRCKRDFTYIDDVVSALEQILLSGKSEELFDAMETPFRVYNIGNENPVLMTDFVRILSDSLIRYGALPTDFSLWDRVDMVGKQAGDPEITCADSSGLLNDYGIKPSVNIEEGLDRFARWFAQYKNGAKK